jgi:hypothetical protein
MADTSQAPDIVRIFHDIAGFLCAMDADGAVFDVTNMFAGGEITDSLAEAESIVVKLAEDSWLSLDISDKTPWIETPK